MAKNKSKDIIENNNHKIDPILVFKNVDFSLLLTVFFAVVIVIVAGMATPYAPNILDLLRNRSEILQPELQRSDFDKRDQLIESQSIKYDKKVELLKEPIITPPYYVDSERLKNYLISKSVSITVTGVIEEAYLYIKTGSLDLENESISFYIVDGNPISGHLFAPKSIFSLNDNEFVYNLKDLPLVKLPYSIKKEPEIVDVVSNVLNHASEIKENLYVGAMVSTTQTPNQVQQIEIRYSCINKGNCEIKVIN